MNYKAISEMLRPCPFCGGEAYLENSHRAFVNGKTTKVTFVRCTECNARAPRVNIADYGHTSRSRDAELKAISMWNRRYDGS